MAFHKKKLLELDCHAASSHLSSISFMLQFELNTNLASSYPPFDPSTPLRNRRVLAGSKIDFHFLPSVTPPPHPHAQLMMMLSVRPSLLPAYSSSALISTSLLPSAPVCVGVICARCDLAAAYDGFPSSLKSVAFLRPFPCRSRLFLHFHLWE